MDTEKRKRGRPPKERAGGIAAIGADAGSPGAAVPARVSPAARTAREDFCFIVGREGDRSFLRLRDAKGGKQPPDFRRYTGLARESLREFLARKNERDRSFIVTFDGSDDDTLYNPDDGLIEKALAAGLLRDDRGAPLRAAEGFFRCVILIEDLGGGGIEVSLALEDEAAAILAREGRAGTAGFYTLSSRLAVFEGRVYPVSDLGHRWAETGRVHGRIDKKELPAYLSLVLSAFPNTELRAEGWTVRRIRPARALPALLFMEIDRYDYLHVRPISFLRGFPPLFLENEDIVTVAEMDEAAKTFGIAELIFPEFPEDLFRTFLNRAGREAAKKSVYEEGGRFIIAPQFARDFLGNSIVELSRQFVLLETEVLAGYKLSFSRPRFRFSMGKGIEYLSGNAEVEIGGERLSFARFMAEYRRSSCITLADGTRSFPDKSTMDKLDRLISQIKGEEEVELSFFDLPLLLRDEFIEIEGEAWERARPFFTGYNTIGERRGSWSLADGTLRPYQEYGVRWLDYLREYGMGACLADEMGLGKTIQVIALLRGLRAEGKTGNCLILCPKSLVFNWAAELDRFGPDLPYLVHYGSGRDTGRLLSGDFRVILSTYATLRRDIEEFQKQEFFYIILDESQNIKNLSTQTTAAVLSLRAAHRLAMSGTPVENNLADLYSLFRFLNPGFFGSERAFTERYLRPIQDGGDEDALRDLRARIYPFMLRRLKGDVLKDLPPKTEETALIELEEAHLAVYHRRRLEYKNLIEGLLERGEAGKSSLFIFKALAELRRLASVPESDGEYGGPSAKRLYLRDMIAGLAESGHKCLVFTNFLAHVDLVSRDLAEMGIPNLTMTGATVDRETLVRRFLTDSAVKAFIMTLKTGGIGLNLTAADYIFILDPWWNSAAESQAIDRSHRIGQANPVFCYRLIAKDTIEERILELQKR
ncbi:MAG: DEAD/DEAH box helicase family protein, partial [Spirochaetaceae bacterium]|nr:DEAD/DEAH box helicase family protein [Spirochaetaceae bacterium]